MARNQTDTPPAPRPQKAYKNQEFLNSPEAREIRVLCEFIEPGARFDQYDVRDTIVFFGSSRALPPEVAGENLRAARRRVESRLTSGGGDAGGAKAALARATRDQAMSRYYRDARVLAEKLTRWSLKIAKGRQRLMICSGGGRGIMEAANRGAAEAGGDSIGLNISLPAEQYPNCYQTEELAFEFHYFFIRKFWFVYLAKAIVVFPGGYGTLDELFELLTLAQTQKVRKHMPIVVYGTRYWNDLIDFDALVRAGTIDREDLDLFRFFDDVDGAFEFLREELKAYYGK